MDMLNDIADEIVTTTGPMEPMVPTSSRKRRAMDRSQPIDGAPAAPLPETRSIGARQQATHRTQPRPRLPAATNSETPRKRQKRAREIVPPTEAAPASPLSDGHTATADQSFRAIGADEAIDAPQPAAVVPRRQKSRARKGVAGQAKNTATSVMELPAPTPIDAGDGVGRSDLTPIAPPGSGVAAASIPAASGGDDRAQPRHGTQSGLSPVVAELVQLWRMRTRWWKAEIKLILQAQAICRAWTDGDKAKAGKLFAHVRDTGEGDPMLLTALGPFLAAMTPFAQEGAAYEKRIAKLARQLPVYPWVKSVWGFSDLALGKIVGEAGDIGSYRNPSCLWKRMGLAVINGIRQRRVTDADEALLHGYNAQRRSTMWNIGNGLIGGMGKGVRPIVGEDWQAREDWSDYQKLYVGRMIYLAERDPEAHARPATDAGKMSFSRHAHNAAKRYVEKRALRDLWSQWRAADRGQYRNGTHSPTAPVGASPDRED